MSSLMMVISFLFAGSAILALVLNFSTYDKIDFDEIKQWEEFQDAFRL